ncbi:hypothetical protein EZV62_007781 [Acer yangbiense]|uniref:Aspartic peptidase DDI1-type domain-containing protein n=1 Tax=Acer yangbiense TaxID=1000413 RepID=A0A5C7IDJ0_9ROSI|nr:hypothetical protein EZV62_007781 [Acer yangbiense]
MSDNHGEGGDKPNDNDRKDKRRSKFPNGDNRRDKPQGGKPKKIKPKSSCFICDGPHWVCNCPKQKMLNAMVTQLEESKATEGQASMGSIQQIYAINGRTMPPTLAKKGLIFVEATIKGKQVRAMLDTGAMHNFISVDEANEGRHYHLGPWSGKLDFSVVPLENYQLVLSMTFFDQANAFHLPTASSLNILDGGKAYTIPVERLTTSEFKTLSAIQLVEKPSSPTSSRNIKPTEAVPKKMSRASHGKRRSKITEGGSTIAKLPL